VNRYLLKTLSKEVYEPLRKDYPHRYKGKWGEEINYKEVVSENANSLLKQLKEKLPEELHLKYDEWTKKIGCFFDDAKFDEAIILLNHLFMGDIEDDSKKLDKQLENRYEKEFNIDSENAFFNILFVDDFYFLHIYQFSLIERYSAGYDENGQICPIIHFDFECTPKRAKEKLKQKSYDLILLDIDFGQQESKAWDVAEDALKRRIPVVMFSKFELAKKYTPFFGKAISRIDKDLDYKEIFKKIYKILKEKYNIEEYDYDNWKILRSSQLRRVGYFCNNQFVGENEEKITNIIFEEMKKKNFTILFIPLYNNHKRSWKFIFFGKKPDFANGEIKYLEPIQRRMKIYGLNIKNSINETKCGSDEIIEKLLITVESASEEVVFPKASKVYDWEKRDKDKTVYPFIGIDMDLDYIVVPSFSKTSMFDIIGPIMVGPSSSHTAGANRIARLARNFAKALKEEIITIKKIKVEMINSFSFTGKGHGSDYAIAAGLLGKMQYDPALSESLKAKTRMKKGKEELSQNCAINDNPVTVKFDWRQESHPEIHNNSIRFHFYKNEEQKPEGDYILTARSWGGGNVQITSLKENTNYFKIKGSDIEVKFSGLEGEKYEDDAINKDRNLLSGKEGIELVLNSKQFTIQSIYPSSIDEIDSNPSKDQFIQEKPSNGDKETLESSPQRPDFLTWDDLLDIKGKKELWEIAIDYERWARYGDKEKKTIKRDWTWKILRKYREIMLKAIDAGLDSNKKTHTDYSYAYATKELVGACLCSRWKDKIITRAKVYAIAVNEVNAKMNAPIVAAPTAGSCGVIPGVLKAMEEYLKEKDVENSLKGLLVAALVGLVINNLVPTAGATAGCQAEMGTAAAMAAAMIAYMLGGSTEAIIHAAALALKNSLGLVCDPLNGKVEVPCIKRAGLKAIEAIGAALSSCAGVRSGVYPWDVVGAMKQIGDDMDAIYKETSKGGLALTRAPRERVIC